MKKKEIPQIACNESKTAIFKKEVTVDIIMGLITVVRMEMEDRNKTMSASDNELTELVVERIKSDNKIIYSEAELYKYYGSIVREIAWMNVNKEESEKIILRLKSGDELFAQKFFYGTNNKDCNIDRFRSKIIYQIKQTYKVDIEKEEVGNILYTYLWDNGTWSVLDKYSGKSSIFSWLEQIAQHEVIRSLSEMKVINTNSERTGGNTRLLGNSVAPEVWSYIISDIMPKGINRNILVASLVERESPEKMMKQFDMDLEIFTSTKKAAENELKNRIINSGNSYDELVIRDRMPRKIEVTDEYLAQFAKWQVDKSEDNHLDEVFGINISKEELNDRVLDFLHKISDNIQWTDEDRLLWNLRYFENESPVELAERFGERRSWIDVRFSRLKKRFNQEVRAWWKKHGE